MFLLQLLLNPMLFMIIITLFLLIGYNTNNQHHNVAVVMASSTTTTSSRNYNSLSPKIISSSSSSASIINALNDLQKYHQQTEQQKDDSNDSDDDMQQQQQQQPLLVSCFITSGSVTMQKRNQIINEILLQASIDEDNSNNNNNNNMKTIATSNNMIMTQPNTVIEAIDFISYNSNTNSNNVDTAIIYYPDPIDIYRNEHLMDILGPMIETFIKQDKQASTTSKISEEDGTTTSTTTSTTTTNTPSSLSTTKLYILIPENIEKSVVQETIEQSIQQLIPYWIQQQQQQRQSSSATTLLYDTILSQIVYVTPKSVLQTIYNDSNNNNFPTSSSSTTSSTSDTINDMIQTIRTTPSILSSLSSNTNHDIIQQQQTVMNLIASYILRPIVQNKYNTIIQSLQRTCSNSFDTTTAISSSDSDSTSSDMTDNNDDSTTSTTTNQKQSIAKKLMITEPIIDMKFVPNFGDLCDAIITNHIDNISSTSTNDKDLLLQIIRKSYIGQQVYTKLYDDIFVYIINHILIQQINILQKTCYDLFKKEISKLVISPNLIHDMNKCSTTSITLYINGLIKLIPKTSFMKSSSIQSQQYKSYFINTITAQQRMYIRKVHEYINNRILLAKSSNKLRPLPRKGITIGLHYLLPKPFGNDYRQDPSMIHATDNMIYIPNNNNHNNKLSDVNTDTILNEEWKQQLVPHPPGNDMIYMQ